MSDDRDKKKLAMDNEKIKTCAKETINSFIKNDFQKNPYHYLYESDVQGELLSQLRNNIQFSAEVDNTEKNNKYSRSIKDKFDLCAVFTDYTLYYYDGGERKKKRADIVCLDLNKVSTGRHDFLFNQPALLGIELKHIRFNYGIRERFSEAIEDARILKRIQGNNINNRSGDGENYVSEEFEWLSICFMPDEYSVSTRASLANFVNEKEFKGSESINALNETYIVGQENIFRFTGKLPTP